MAENSFFTYDRQGKVVAFVESTAGTNRLVMLRQGRTVFTRPLSATSGGLAFGNAIFSPKGDRLWATYQEPAGTNIVSYGLMEIPLSDAPVHKLTLIPAAPADKDSNASFFQFGMSHDGKTAAVVSTYLAGGSTSLKSKDYALFFVDLSDPNRKLTKVPLPGPPAPTEKK